MIIKRKLKRMPRSNEEEEEGRAPRKKRKVRSYYYPLSLLGEISAGIVPGKLNGKNGFSALWCNEVSCSSSSPVESESKSKRIVIDPGRGSDRTAGVSRPPLVRTSRGRVQVLPSRFNDSVLENWRKDGRSSGEEREEEVEGCRKEKVKAKFGPRNHKYSSSNALCDERDDEDEEMMVRYSNNSFDVRKHVSSSEARPKKEGVYGPEDFYAGDLVWGKSGRNEPFWPAIIIDPMTQAPELVLRSCIPDAACVMFFGHSGTENERVMCMLSCLYDSRSCC